MCNQDKFEEDVDFLFQNRKRLGSDCFSSNQTNSRETGVGSNDFLSVADPSTLPQDVDIEVQSIDFNAIQVVEQTSDEKDIFSICDENLRGSITSTTSAPLEDCIVEEKVNVIPSLSPVTVSASNENSTDESNEQTQSMTKQPVISREGRRKNKPNSPASMIQHNVKRTKKTNDQVEYLRQLFDKLGGRWDGKVRKEAMQKTGLSRIQIYKWFFDMKL